MKIQEKAKMAGFRNRLQDTINSTKQKVRDAQTQSRFQKSGLCSYGEAWPIVYPEFEYLIGRVDWSEPGEDQTEEEFKIQLSDLVERFFGANFEQKKFVGSVAAIFNFTLIYFICRALIYFLNLLVLLPL